MKFDSYIERGVMKRWLKDDEDMVITVESIGELRTARE
jgi:hypothetical protein